jgi:translation initiation factor 2A
MPAKTVLFDRRVRPLHAISSSRPNYRIWSIDEAHFGEGTSVKDFDSPGKIACEGERSPDGRFLLTATLSPLLGVDNNDRIEDLVAELAASWR